MQTPVSRTTDTWTWMKNLVSNTYYVNHVAVLLGNGKVLIAGGAGKSGEAPTITQLFDPNTNTWTQASNLNAGRPSDPTATLLGNGKVLLVGGAWSSSDKTAELYDPTANTWAKTTDMKFAHREQTTTLLSDGKVLVAGGTGDAGKTAELYNPADGTFTRTSGDPTVARASHTATLLPSRQVLLVGGEGSDAGTTAELYDPAADTWTKLDQSLSPARVHHTSTLLPNGRVLVAGGGTSGSETPSAVLYSPRSNGWAPASSMTVPRTNHTATLLQNGTVLVVGGSGSVTTSQTSQQPDGTLTVASATTTSANNTAEFYVAFPFADSTLIALKANSGLYWARRSVDLTVVNGYRTDSAIEAAGTAIDDSFNPAEKLIVRVLSNNQIALAIPGMNTPGVLDNYLGRVHRVSDDAEFDAIEATSEATFDSIGSTCQFTVGVLSNGLIALQADNTCYLYRSDRYNLDLIEVLKTAIDITCQFTVVYLG